MTSIEMPGQSTDSAAAPGFEAMPGKAIYEYTPQVTQIIEYGASADAVFSGQTPPPAEGARFDLYLEGPVTGRELNGTVKGVDYLNYRADGRAELHIHAEITTDDGKKIALVAGGVAIPQKGTPVFQLRENVKLTSNHPELSWVNPIQIWAHGTVDVSTGQVHVSAYAI
ncbi:MAG: DUF3237 family protein [Solirubrobacteraceae bacterium]